MQSNVYSSIVVVIIGATLLVVTNGFSPICSTTIGYCTSKDDHLGRCTTSLCAKKGSNNKKKGLKSSAGKGFGSASGKDKVQVTKTYGSYTNSVISMDSIVSSEHALAEFFTANEPWHPLFRSIASSPSEAMNFLKGTHGEELEFNDEVYPWRRLSHQPEGEDSLAYLATFLDSMQKALIDIPVAGLKKEDEHDIHFIEEGRRMLLVERFHVLPGVNERTADSHEQLFTTCWSEIQRHVDFNFDNTGSLILLPDYDMEALRTFTEINVMRPLNWLGILQDFEITTLQRDIPAIRMIYKVGDVPDLADRKQ